MMRRTMGGLLLGVCMLTACQIPVITEGTGKRVNKATPRPSTAPTDGATPSAGPSTVASTQAGTSPQPSASASVVPASTPPSPTIPTTPLSGLVKMDGSYVIATGGGNFVATNGGGFVATNGGSVISVGGGNVIATGGGNVIATGGGNFVATNGGTVISVGGGNVISTGGGNVISTGGGNVISTGGGNYRLLADAFRILAEGPAAGEMVPIKGLVVVPVSLSTGKPIGEAVFTNEKGEYTLKVPQAHKENVLVYAAVPGKGVEDLALINNSRLRLGAIVDPDKPKETVIDEDSGQVTRYALLCLTNRLRRVFEAPGTDVPAEVVTSMADLSPEARLVLAAGLKELKAVAETTPFKKMTERDKQLFMHKINDVVIANVKSPNLEELTIKAHHLHYFRDEATPLEGRSAIAVFKAISVALRPKAQAMLAQKPTALDDLLKLANDYRATVYEGTPPLKIERPVDVLDFVVKAYMAENPENGAYSGLKAGSSDDAAGTVFNRIDGDMMTLADDPKPGTEYAAKLVLRAATMATLEGATMAIFNDAVKKALTETMTSYQPMDPLKP